MEIDGYGVRLWEQTKDVKYGHRVSINMDMDMDMEFRSHGVRIHGVRGTEGSFKMKGSVRAREGNSILKELIQNADDAGAHEVQKGQGCDGLNSLTHKQIRR